MAREKKFCENPGRRWRTPYTEHMDYFIFTVSTTGIFAAGITAFGDDIGTPARHQEWQEQTFPGRGEITGP